MSPRLTAAGITGIQRRVGLDHVVDQPERCHLLTADDLADAAIAISDLLTQAHEQQIDELNRLGELSGFSAARGAVVAVGGDLDLGSLASVGAGTLLTRGGLSAAGGGIRLATYCADGDADTDELVGLDIAGTIPNGLRLAGWDLVRFDDEGLADYEVVPGVTPRTGHWWTAPLRRTPGGCAAPPACGTRSATAASCSSGVASVRGPRTSADVGRFQDRA